jgi:hypothetical protein
LAAVTVAALAACTEPADGRQPQKNPAPPSNARKGIGLALGKTHGITQLESVNIDWFYTWGASRPTIRSSEEFVPMIWGRESVRQGSVDEVQAELGLTRASELLAFNEPDHPDQSDMSVATAIKYWPRLEVSGLRLSSPAPVEAMGDWLKRFMDEANKKDLRVDFIAMHSYASPNSESFLEKVREVHNYYDKPIWITEYAVADWEATAKSPSNHSEKDIMSFMQETAAGLREMPFVERFAWKTREVDDPIMGASALFRKDGSLTATGELYRSL